MSTHVRLNQRIVNKNKNIVIYCNVKNQTPLLYSYTDYIIFHNTRCGFDNYRGLKLLYLSPHKTYVQHRESAGNQTLKDVIDRKRKEELNVIE